MNNKKKIILAAIAVLFIVRIGYIAIRGEVDKLYYTSCNYDLSQAAPLPCLNISETFKSSQDRLDSLELIFTGIAEDGAGAVILCIYSENTLLYQTNISLAYVNNFEWKKVMVNAPLRSSNTYTITLNANEECTQIPNLLVVNGGYASELVETYAGDEKIDGNVALNFGYLQFPGRADRMVMISLWVIFYVVIFLVIKNTEKIVIFFVAAKEALMANVNETAFFYALEMVLCLAILNCSGIEFQEMTKVIFYVVSLVAVTNYKKKKSFIDGLLNENWKRMLLVFLYLYASFALVGQRILIYPFNLKLTTHGVFVLICAALWFVPVVNSILFYIENAAKSVFGKSANMKTWQFIMLHMLILLLPAAYNLFANNPGISSPDTSFTMITCAQHLYGMSDWHPAFYCMVLRVIEEMWNSTYAVIAVQYFFWAYVVIEFFLYLRKKGLSDMVLIAVSLFCGFNAGNFLHLNTIWKDIPYTLSLLWIFVLVAKLSIDFDEYRRGGG